METIMQMKNKKYGFIVNVVQIFKDKIMFEMGDNIRDVGNLRDYVVLQ